MLVLLFAVILFACWQTRYVASLLLYFLAQAWYTAIVTSLFYWRGETTIIYGVAYAALTGLILLACLNIVREAVGHQWKVMAVPAVLTLGLAKLAYLGLGHAPRWYDWIGLAEGAVLFWAGMLLGGKSPYTKRPNTFATLALLWLALALFRWGFYIHLPSALWIRLNLNVPALLCIAAFLTVGLLERHHTRAEAEAFKWHLLRTYGRDSS